MTSRAQFIGDEVARAGIYLGPLMLASHTASGVFRTICEGRSDFVVLGTSLLPFAAVFIVLAVWLAWLVKDLPLRLASLAFALHQLAMVYEWLASVRLPETVGWLGVISALLLTVSGMRSPVRHKLLIAPAVFVLASLAFFAGIRYGNQLSGHDSVLRLAPICSFRDDRVEVEPL